MKNKDQSLPEETFCGTAALGGVHPFFRINSVQTRYIVKGEAQKSPLFSRFSGNFCFSQDRLFSRNSTKPLNLINSPIFTNTPCKSICLYNAPSMHTVDKKRSSFERPPLERDRQRGREQERERERENPRGRERERETF